MPGSSPLTRGKQVGAGFRRSRGRLIPAHAGKTVLRVLRAGACAAHPRSRGENHPPQAGTRRYHGSSPLTRGKLHLRGVRPRVRGLIPAHAGKTGHVRLRHAGDPAHPRSRGENPNVASSFSAAGGSSPLTRGKRGHRRTRGGIHLAHPRSRGENRRWSPMLRRPAGSSPLTRGKRVGLLNDLGQIRLIPAHAGKTPTPCSAPAAGGAHPRSRGENKLWWPSPTALAGSSPLTRGKPGPAFVRSPRPRLIPAHAGKTQVRSVNEETRSAHPRSRGENYQDRCLRYRTSGSSPLTRGKPCRRRTDNT